MVLGSDVVSDPESIKQHVGYVPELHHIYRWMRLGDVIAFASSFYPTWNNQLCEELLDLFDLPLKKKIRHLSKGMLAKLGLLLAVSHSSRAAVST